MTRDHMKSTRYIQELDDARCAGNWDAVPELVRKVKKHAPERTCLAVTAEAEHALSKLTTARPGTARPSTARPTTAVNDANDVQIYISTLVNAIANEKNHQHDEFQGKACLGWVYWHQGNVDAALSALPKDVEREYAQLCESITETSKWTRVCAVRSVYIRGTGMLRAGKTSDALQIFESGLPILNSTAVQSSKEERVCAELYLSNFCHASGRTAADRTSNVAETGALTAFRAWARLWNASGATAAGGRAVGAELSRRALWKEYYALLTTVLEKDLPFPTTSLITSYEDATTKSRQRAELKSVESKYEALILSEVPFPKAEESSEEVEAFIDLVMQNWRVLCGAQWQEIDIGESGAEGMSRGVLDILYRAATKTFHSTSLLRHLFTVHLSIAEFELAFKAYDTYLEIVKKGKARVEKTGIPEQGLDSDENVLRTTSEYIKALCRYGGREESKKAKETATFFKAWLEKHYPLKRAEDHNPGVDSNNATQPAKISPKVFALTWRSIGIAYAQWARLTFDGSARSDVQLKAIQCFRRALSDEYEGGNDVETLFALGTILAERRELGPAVEIIKQGLLPQAFIDQETSLGPYAGRFARERALIQLWHLLALLLSARQEFGTAIKSCEAAFEQFQDPKTLFGAEELAGTFRSEHLNEKAAARNIGVVDEMDDYEKENVLEVKITQLSLVEVLEGPEFAVNASDELLSLYARLFGEPHEDLAVRFSDSVTLREAPKSSAGTIRSVKGSIFGRKSRSLRNSHMGSVEEEKGPRPQTSHTVAPKIQVTNENGSTSKHHRHSKEHHHHEKLHKKDSVQRKKSGGSLRKRDASATRAANSAQSPTVVDGENFFTPGLSDKDSWQDADAQSSQVGIAVTREDSAQDAARHTSDADLREPHPPHTQQLDHSEPALQDIEKQDTRLPMPSSASSSSPRTRFPKDQSIRRRISMLVKVWLLIAGFYRRASLLKDAKGAIEEAAKLVDKMEADVSQELNPSVTVESSGMGGGKTVNELWGDVLSERGYLASAASDHYKALSHFESALTSDANHPSATVGLSNILLDIFSEELIPPSSLPQLIPPGPQLTPNASTVNTAGNTLNSHLSGSDQKTWISGPGPLGISVPPRTKISPSLSNETSSQPTQSTNPAQPETNSTISKKTQRLDRLAARDRAYGLLSNLTKLGSGWNYSEAWFALARAYELGGQETKARDVLWWCVELEESRPVRGFMESFGGGNGGGYVL